MVKSFKMQKTGKISANYKTFLLKIAVEFEKQGISHFQALKKSIQIGSMYKHTFREWREVTE